MAGSTTPSAANASEQFFHYFQHEVAGIFLTHFACKYLQEAG
jgi:hypothetical protein